MGRRIRHLNARDAGAVLVLDSRFITGLSDGDAIETWSDRSRNGNNVTQGTIANRPTFKTSIQGGNPVVRFDGDNDRLTNIITNLIVAGSAWGLIASGKMDPTITQLNGAIFTSRTGTKYWSCMYLAFQTSQYISGNGVDISANTTVANFSFRTSPWVSTWNMNGNGVALTHYANGSQIGITSGVQVTETGTTGFEIGANSANQRMKGDIWLINILPGVNSNSLRRRIEQSAAFSFKLPCS